jgi:hypothetical protein
MTKLIVAFRSYANAPNNVFLQLSSHFDISDAYSFATKELLQVVHHCETTTTLVFFECTAVRNWFSSVSVLLKYFRDIQIMCIF